MRIKRRRKSIYQAVSFVDEYSKDIVELWILRLLVTLNGNNEFIDGRSFYYDNLAVF